MIHELAQLGRNLVAGLKLALFLPVSRLAFRIDAAQLLLLFSVSAIIDVGTDWIRFGPEARFSWQGAGAEFFTVGLLLLVAAVQGLVFRQRALLLAVPVLALAAYPIVQLVHTAPYVLTVAEGWLPSWTLGAIDIAMTAWSFAVFVRVVALSLAPARPRLWPRALAGGLMLALPLAFAPALTPTESWWRPLSASADGRYPNPASEPVLAAQKTLLDDALSNLDDEMPGETDLYFIGFAGDARDEEYGRDVEEAQRAMDERWDTRDRSIVLLNNPATVLQTPMATVTHLRETLKEVAAAINPDEDVVMLYFSGPADRDGALDVAMPPLDLLPVAPSVLRALLDESGIIWRIVVVSSCRADAFAEALRGDTTLVMTAAGDDATGGCARRGGSSILGGALFRDALAHAESMQQAFDEALAASGTPESPGAQLVIGPAMAEKLKELDRGRASRGAGRTI
jgi:hypothetical protein